MSAMFILLPVDEVLPFMDTSDSGQTCRHKRDASSCSGAKRGRQREGKWERKREGEEE